MNWQSDEVVVLIKAAPNATNSGETVCCAGVDPYGNWKRLYPVSFRDLTNGQKFKRWDRIAYRWRKPSNDGRIESQRVDHGTIGIVGQLKSSGGQREKYLAAAVVSSLAKERAEGRSLALLRSEILSFEVERKTPEEIANDSEKFKALRNQRDFFSSAEVVPYKPCPYSFKYRYKTDDGVRTGTCQDWETEATFWNWRKATNEEKALNDMKHLFGQEYPDKGMLLAMGTHSRYPDTWLINGIIRLNVDQGSLF